MADSTDQPRQVKRHTKQLFSWRGGVVDSDLPANARLVALVLSLHMSELGDSCFPSITTLERETGLSRRTVFRMILLLRQTGWLSCKRTPGRVSHYAASFPQGLPTGVTVTPPPVSPTTPTGVTVTPEYFRSTKTSDLIIGKINTCPDCNITFKAKPQYEEHRYNLHDGPEPEHYRLAEAKADD